jgi:uncharacterized membrane protein
MKSWARHSRFLIAFAIGLATLGLTIVLHLDGAMRSLLSVNGFFVSYLVLMLWLTVSTSPADLRRHSEQDDEGMALIVVLALGAVVIALASVVMVLSNKTDSVVDNVLALAAVPMGWAMLHMLAAYHYAHLYYAPDPDGGLEFPGKTKTDPGTWDFLYFSFTIGMTAQVSDVVITTSQLRRAVLLHSMGAFFYNTVILALAVNAGLALNR